jgi:hypothetical protein
MGTIIKRSDQQTLARQKINNNNKKLMVERVYVLAWTVQVERSYRKLSLPPAAQGTYLVTTYLTCTIGYFKVFKKIKSPDLDIDAKLTHL